jgi:hypothetical protein
MNARITIIILMLLSATTSCTTIKIGLFRAVMGIFGGFVKFHALYSPEFIPANEADYLLDEDEVIGLSVNGVAKAYPLTMSFWHHIINDEIGGEPVVVTFCPLTHTAMVFDPIVDGKQVLQFSVEGSLKEANMIMEDDSTNSHWQQITREAISGTMQQRKLGLLFGLHTTWDVWRELHPQTLVLAKETGYDYDYSEFPFQERYFKYKKSPNYLYKVSHKDNRYHPKEVMLGVAMGNVHKAYPFSELRGTGVINDTVAGVPIVVFYDIKNETIAAYQRFLDNKPVEFRTEMDSEGLKFKDSIYDSSWNIEGIAYEGPFRSRSLRYVPSYKAFWFAWVTVYPETMVYVNTRSRNIASSTRSNM